MNIKSQKDFLSGVLLMGTGLAFAWGGSLYPVGSAARMGPGYFPMLVGMLLALLGGAIVFKALVIETESGGKTGPWVWRPVACIVLADLAFALLVQGVPQLGLPPMGMVAGVFALTLIAARAGPVFRWKEALLMAALLAAASYLLLVGVLKLPLQAWPALTPA